MASNTPFFRRTAFVVAIALITAASAASGVRADDSGSVTGTVAYWQSERPVGGVTVEISGNSGPSQIFLTTDRMGKYNAVGLEPGRYRAVFAKADMDSEVSAFEICPGSVTSMDIFMIDSPRVCGMCAIVRSQPKQTVRSTSSTFVTSNQWPRMLDQFCL